MPNLTIRWANDVNTTDSSKFLVSFTTDNVNWSTAASQLASSPYASASAILGQNEPYNSSSILLSGWDNFSASGYALIEDAQIAYSGITGSKLTGASWLSGYGTYAAGTEVYEAHESYSASVTITASAVLYKITHVDSSNIESAPAYLMYYYPDAPMSSHHCKVIIDTLYDIGWYSASGISCSAYINDLKDFNIINGAHILKNQNPEINHATTNTFGLAVFDCWKNKYVEAVGGALETGYTFVVGSNTFTAATIPDQNFVLLKDIVDS